MYVLERVCSSVSSCSEVTNERYLQKAEVRRLQERCRISESHLKVTKQQLSRSDQQRQDAIKQLDKLKQEVHEMKRAVPKRTGTNIAPLSARGHASSNSQQHNSSRMALCFYAMGCCKRCAHIYDACRMTGMKYME